MKLPIDVHIIFQPGCSQKLFDECVSSITDDVNVIIINDNDGKSVVENRAAGFQQGNSEWVSYVDYDDLVYSSAFEKLHQFAVNNNHSAVFGNSFVDKDGDKDILFTNPKQNPKILFFGYTGVHQLYLVKRDIMMQALDLVSKIDVAPAIFDYVLTCAVALLTDWHFLNEITYIWQIRGNSLHRTFDHVQTLNKRLAAVEELQKVYKNSRV